MSKESRGTIEPTGGSPFAVHDAGFHVVLGVEVRPGGVWRADTVDDGELALGEVLMERLESGMKAKSTVQSEQSGVALGGEEKLRSKFAQAFVAYGLASHESVHGSSLKKTYQSLGLADRFS